MSEIEQFDYQVKVAAEKRPCGSRPCVDEFPGIPSRWCSGCLISALLARLREVQKEANKWANQAVADCGNAIYWRDKHDHAEAERDQLRQQLVEKEQDLHFQVLEWAAAQAQLTTLREALTNLLAQSGDPNAVTGEFDTVAGRARRALNASRPAPKE